MSKKSIKVKKSRKCIKTKPKLKKKLLVQCFDVGTQFDYMENSECFERQRLQCQKRKPHCKKRYSFGIQADFTDIVNECENLLEQNMNIFNTYLRSKAEKYAKEYGSILISASTKNRTGYSEDDLHAAHELQSPEIVRPKNKNIEGDP